MIRNEHDACGVGFVAHIKGEKSHAIITQALEILKNMTIAARWAPTRCWATARAS
jgi:glutamate synthase domain-containing protein 1